MSKSSAWCCFNEAAIFRSRKPSSPAQARRGLARFNEAAIFRSRKRALPGPKQAQVLASMRPRSFDRGNYEQPGRQSDALRASMRPRSFDRGNGLEERRVAATCARFNEAAIFRSRKRPRAGRLDQVEDASMRPRSFDRGNSALFNYSIFKDLAAYSRAALTHSPGRALSVRWGPAHLAENTSHFLMRVTPAFHGSPGLSRNSSRHKYRIFPQLPFDRFSQETRLNLKQAAVADSIVEERMRHQCIHPRFIGSKEILATGHS